MAKEHTVQKQEYFLKYNYPKTCAIFVDRVYKAAQEILLANSIELNEKNFWASSILPKQEKLQELWDDTSVAGGNEFKLIWASFVVREYGFMIWNEIFTKINKEKGEHPAHKAAETAQADFLKKWK